jgi:hypothetical protein
VIARIDIRLLLLLLLLVMMLVMECYLTLYRYSPDKSFLPDNIYGIEMMVQPVWGLYANTCK